MTTQFVNSFPSINDKSMIYFGPTADASATRANQISSRKYEYIWTKPDGCRFVFIMAVGGGGGGGGGGSYPIGTKSCGAGGGAGSCVAYQFYNAVTLPNVLYVSPGCGGLGGSGASSGPGSAGLAGTISLVSLNPYKTSTPSVALIATGSTANQISGNGGGGGTSSTGGSIGTNNIVTGSSNFLFSLMFQTISSDSIIPGQDYAYGLAGGNDGVGASVTQTGGYLTFGGAGGGGVTSGGIAFSGGSVFPVNNQNATVGGLFPYALGGTSGVDGESGFKFCAIRGPSIEGISYPFVQCAGAGGGAQVNGNGGRGGDGAPGSGGGGGGAAVGTGVFGGSGGNGGPGFIIITPIF